MYHPEDFYDQEYYYNAYQKYFSDVELLDYSHWPCPDHFRADEHHLNYKGACCFTLELRKRISTGEICNLCDEMINITEKTQCCGCNACGDVCPYRAISFKTDEEGFWYPVIDGEKCVDCGLCDKVCPVIHADALKKNDLKEPVCYAAIHKNMDIRFDSTSGGIFSALAAQTYKDSGYVGGAIYDQDFFVRHFISNDKKDLSRLRSSKYLQSNLSGIYKEVKSLLQDGRKVLICGTPCQMAGLRSFLGKDYENLILIDFVCRGINSPKVHRKYLDFLEKKYNSKVVYLKSKNKELGWRNLTQKVIFENGSVYYGIKGEDLYNRGYLQTNVFCRPSCFDCQFKGFPRIADISLADFWGIEKFDTSMDGDVGTSMVLINSEKGKLFFEKIQKYITIKELPFDSIFPGNPALIKSLDPPKVERAAFFSDLGRLTFEQLAEKYFPIKSLSKMHRLKQMVKLLLAIKRYTHFHPRALYQFMKLNFFHSGIVSDWKHGGLIIPTPHCIFEIDKGAKVEINGMFIFGLKKFEHSRLESRLLVEKDCTLKVEKCFYFGYGSDIEVMKGGKLIIGGGIGSNINTTIICSDEIHIGENVAIGRDVTIRDNNGGHVIARLGYRDSAPVYVGNHVWLCSGCTIMSGVKVGQGAIVGANSFVISPVPARSIVSGSPAVVVDREVVWKY